MEDDSIIRQGREIIFQAFNWESHSKQWWRVLESKVLQLAEAGFTSLWLPPASDSLSPQGYLPRDLYCLNSGYGSESELRSLLQVIHSNGLRAMADVVINHRVGSTKGSGGLYNRYDGLSIPWDEKAVTSNTGGHGNPSTGDAFGGVPNIDHTQEFVRRDLKEWLRWLRRDVGFNDFRFDFAKGYKADFVKEYIQAADPEFSVGEYWDTCNYVDNGQLDYNQDSHRQRIVDWIDQTGGLSSAFDFTSKAILQESMRKGEFWRLKDPHGKPSGVVGMWPSRAVTFVDNHDTGSTQAHWPFPPEHVLKGYAYILTHPGIPTIFYDHFYEWGTVQESIRSLIAIRKHQDLHSRSSIRILEANNSLYAAIIGEKVCVKIGPGNWTPHGEGWELATWGNEYAVWQNGIP